MNVQALNPKPLPAYLQLDRMADWLLEAQPEGRTGARYVGLLGFACTNEVASSTWTGS